MGKVNDFDVVQSAVYNALGIGKENAISRTELAIKTGYQDRLIRKAIESLRKDMVIINLDTGYYIPHSNAQGRCETYRWLKRQRSRMKSIKTATRGAQKFVDGKKKQFPGQICMWDE